MLFFGACKGMKRCFAFVRIFLLLSTKPSKQLSSRRKLWVVEGAYCLVGSSSCSLFSEGQQTNTGMKFGIDSRTDAKMPMRRACVLAKKSLVLLSLTSFSVRVSLVFDFGFFSFFFPKDI